jgi:hypothetical protein
LFYRISQNSLFHTLYLSLYRLIWRRKHGPVKKEASNLI